MDFPPSKNSTLEQRWLSIYMLSGYEILIHKSTASTVLFPHYHLCAFSLLSPLQRGELGLLEIQNCLSFANGLPDLICPDCPILKGLCPLCCKNQPTPHSLHIDETFIKVFFQWAREEGPENYIYIKRLGSSTFLHISNCTSSWQDHFTSSSNIASQQRHGNFHSWPTTLATSSN